MASSTYRVPLPETLAQAVDAESIRSRLPARTIIAAFFLDKWGEWQGGRMNDDFGDLRQVMSIDELLNQPKP